MNVSLILSRYNSQMGSIVKFIDDLFSKSWHTGLKFKSRENWEGREGEVLYDR